MKSGRTAKDPRSSGDKIRIVDKLISDLVFVRIPGNFEYENTTFWIKQTNKIDFFIVEIFIVVIATETCVWCFRTRSTTPIFLSRCTTNATSSLTYCRVGRCCLSDIAIPVAFASLAIQVRGCQAR